MDNLVKRKKSRLEHVFQGELRDSLFFYFPDIFYYKLPDGISVGGEKTDENGKSIWTRFIPEKPFDAMFSYRKIHCAMEYKVHKKHTAWPLSAMRPSQITGLNLADKNGKYGFVFLNVRYGLGNSRTDIVYVIHISEINRLNDEGIKSLSLEKLKFYTSLEKEKVGENKFWNVNKFIKTLQEYSLNGIKLFNFDF